MHGWDAVREVRRACLPSFRQGLRPLVGYVWLPEKNGLFSFNRCLRLGWGARLVSLVVEPSSNHPKAHGFSIPLIARISTNVCRVWLSGICNAAWKPFEFVIQRIVCNIFATFVHIKHGHRNCKFLGLRERN